MTTLNIGIVAHVDAGKTSLTERILYETHVISEIGRVDSGTTQTDTLELERRRGITIKASVVSFVVNDHKVNLIDTPGHADFLAEVERSLSVLDGAILLISAVEGIQAQTTILFSALQKLHIPTLIFINKIDRAGAQTDQLLTRIRQRLSERILPFYRVERIGTKQARVIRNDLRDPAFRQACVEQLALGDDRLLAAYLGGASLSAARIGAELERQSRAGRLYPVFFGSAITGVGVRELLADLVRLLPSSSHQEDAPLAAAVFKLERQATGEKVAYVRVFAGSLRVKNAVELRRRTREGGDETHIGKVQKLHLFQMGKTEQASAAPAGEFCKVWGLKEARIGDALGAWSDHIRALRFAIPRLETRIEVQRPTDDHRLYQALLELAEEDPLISVLRDTLHQAIYLRIFGEVQKEVIETTLAERYGLDVRFAPTSVVCVEKPRGVGRAAEFAGAADNPFVATVGFRVEPGPVGSGLTYAATPGILPLAFARIVEETARATLAQGLCGWEVTDAAVTLYHTAWPPGSTAGDFRRLTPLVVMQALAQADTDVYEPINQFELSVPAFAISAAMFRLSALRGVYDQPILRGESFTLTGSLPAATTEEFRRALPSFTEGQGALLAQEGGYRKLAGAFPTRKRMDYNPLNRKEYLLHIQRVS